MHLGHGRGRYSAGLAAFRQGRLREAANRLRGAKATIPEEINSLRLLGLTCLAMRDCAGAVRHLADVVRAAPSFLPAHVDLARAYRATGRLDEALAQLRPILRLAPTLGMAWLALADVHWERRARADARDAFRRALRLDPRHVRLREARRARAHGKTAEAARLFQSVLQEDAGSLGALCGLAAIHLEAGRPDEAERLLEHARLQSAHCPDIGRLQGQAYLAQGRLTEALHAIEQVLALESEDVQSLIALGAVTGRLMRPEASLAAYRQAEHIAPRHPLLHLSIGHVLKALGRRSECEQVYRECIERQQAPSEAWVSLADLKNYRFSDADITAMESALAQHDDDADAARLHFALGRAREQRDEHAQAFAHYTAGNRMRRQDSAFDFDAFEAKCTRLIAAMDQAFIRGNEHAGDSDPAPIFIVGLPRSGSTLVEQILASHSSVEGTMELPNIQNYVRELEYADGSGDAYPQSAAAAPREVFAALGRRYLRETRPLRTGRARFIDKLPNNFAHIGLIHAMLPNATIIDVRRHPMDAGLSCYKQHFAQGQSFTYDLAGLGRYYRQYLALMHHWDTVLPGKVLHLQYEELVRSPEATIRRLLAHCGLAFEATCLAFHETDRPVRTASSEQVRLPLYSGGVGYWRRFETELEPLRAALGECLQHFPSYDLPAAATAGPVTPWRRPCTTMSLALAAVLYAGFAQRAALAGANDEVLGEVVVTARKRSENLQDVPQAIEVFTADDVRNLSLARFEDFATLAPSISLLSTGPGQQRIFMRGVSDGSSPNYGYGNLSTTAFLIDDLSLAVNGREPDIHLYDVERIEVLNGPQGTLFGPGALSGAVRIVTRKPDAGGFGAGADLDAGHVQNGGNNVTFEGYLNVPLIPDKAAIRLVAYNAREGGYIDNVLATRDWLNGVTSSNAPWAGRNQNTRDIVGGRVGLRYHIAENWQVTLTGHYQQQRYSGSWEDDPDDIGIRQQRRFSPAGGFNYDRFLELNLQGDVGIADLIYVGGFTSHQSLRLYDFSEYAQYSSYAALVQSTTCLTDPASGPGDHGCRTPYMFGAVRSLVKRRSHELRLLSKAGGRAHWTLGAYWEKTRDPDSGFEHLPNVNFAGGPAQDLVASYGNVAKPLSEEFYSTFATADVLRTSEFGDVTYDLSEHWSVEAGIDHFHSSFSAATDWAGYFWNEKTPSFSRNSSGKTNYRAGLTYKPVPGMLLYFSFAQGIREGGFNSVPTDSIHPVPKSFSPDTLNNYELGWKSELLGGRVIWNGAGYYMAWKDYQTGINVSYPPYGFNANLGDARVVGLETTLEWLPLDGLHITTTANYNDARLRGRLLPVDDFAVLPGQRLPDAPLFNFNAIVRYERTVMPGLRASGQLDVAHKGSMWNALQTDLRTRQPSYTLSNLRVGLRNPLGHWQAEAYVSNLTNKRAVIYSNVTGYNFFPGDSTPEIATPPRTIGLHLSYTWGR